VLDEDGAPLTNSVLEAHRLNSEYIARTPEFKNTIEKEIRFRKDKPFDIFKQLVPVLLKYDPNSLLHGIFLEEVAGVIRLPRTLSAFIEAEDASVAASGGVKFNRVEPEIKGGEGNVPYSRDEWTAAKITAYFNLDLRQIWAFGFGDAAERLLIALALFKIAKFLAEGLRLRTACDFEAAGVRVTRPSGFVLPDLGALASELPGIIVQAATAGAFGAERTLTVTYRK
jgi:CRISPR-associated protein Csb1